MVHKCGCGDQQCQRTCATGQESQAYLRNIRRVFDIGEEDEEDIDENQRPNLLGAHVMEEDEDPDELNVVGETVVTVAIDSGAGAHVMNPDEVPGMNITESVNSKKGRGFVAACGTRIPNQGEIQMIMSGDDCSKPIRSTFQAANVTRALYSVSQICDTGCEVNFNKTVGIVKRNGREIARFPRKGKLYVANKNVKSPPEQDTGTRASDFTRQGRKA